MIVFPGTPTLGAEMEFGVKGIPVTFTWRDFFVSLLGAVGIYLVALFLLGALLALLIGLIAVAVLAIGTANMRERHGPEWIWAFLMSTGFEGDVAGQLGNVTTTRHLTHMWLPERSRFRSGPNPHLGVRTREHLVSGPLLAVPLTPVHEPRIARSVVLPPMQERGIIAHA